MPHPVQMNSIQFINIPNKKCLNDIICYHNQSDSKLAFVIHKDTTHFCDMLKKSKHSGKPVIPKQDTQTTEKHIKGARFNFKRDKRGQRRKPDKILQLDYRNGRHNAYKIAIFKCFH